MNAPGERSVTFTVQVEGALTGVFGQVTVVEVVRGSVTVCPSKGITWVKT